MRGVRGGLRTVHSVGREDIRISEGAWNPRPLPLRRSFHVLTDVRRKDKRFSDYSESKGGDVAADGEDLLASKWHLYSFLYLIHSPVTLLCRLFWNNRAFPPPFITSESQLVIIPSGFHTTHSHYTACSNSALQVSEGIYAERRGADRRLLYTTQKFPPSSTLCSVFSPLYSVHYFSLLFIFIIFLLDVSSIQAESRDRYSLCTRKMEHLWSEKQPSTQPVSLVSHYGVFIHVLLAECNFLKCTLKNGSLVRSGRNHVSVCAAWLCNLSMHQQAV